MQIRNEIKEFKKTPSETQTSEDYYYLLKVQPCVVVWKRIFKKGLDPRREE